MIGPATEGTEKEDRAASNKRKVDELRDFKAAHLDAQLESGFKRRREPSCALGAPVVVLRVAGP